MGFERILAFTDLSPNSCHGLALAENLARRFHARVTVGYVHTRLDVLREFAGDDDNTRRMRAWVRTEDEEHLAALSHSYIERLRLSGIETTVADSAREGVGLLLKRVKPRLVCMATHGRTGLASVLLGSVAEHTIRTAEAPVMVTRGAVFPRPERPIRVLLGIDLTEEPTPLVRRAARFLEPTDELVLVHVVESGFWSLASYGSQFAMPQLDLPGLEQAARDKLEGISLRPRGPRVTVEVRSGRPSDVMLRLARELKPDLVAVRTHGRGGFDHLMLGSVAERLVRRAQVPILVYPKR